MTTDRLSAWAASTTGPVIASNGNTAWSQRYSRELREVILGYASRLPRNMQRHLGPSELGSVCDRKTIGKMAGVDLTDATNHIHDNWASIVGTAIHAFMDDAFAWAAQNGTPPGRWAPERRVTPDPGSPYPHPGTADLYDFQTRTVSDWKAQSEGVRARLRTQGPPYHYFMQLLLYAVGYMNEGFEVDRVCLVSLPRTKSSLDDMYVWEHGITNDDLRAVADLIDKTKVREELGKVVAAGGLNLMDIPATPSDEECTWCPFYRPQAARDPSVKGCPGTAMMRR